MGEARPLSQKSSLCAVMLCSLLTLWSPRVLWLCIFPTKEHMDMKASKQADFEKDFHQFSSLFLFPEIVVCPLGNLTGKITTGSLKAKINGKKRSKVPVSDCSYTDMNLV